MPNAPYSTLCKQVEQRLRTSALHVFSRILLTDSGVRCEAQTPTSKAFYALKNDAGDTNRVWVGLYTPDRWLSESIEAELMFRGDKIEELLEEELADQGCDETHDDGTPGLPIEHFRDESKLYVFRSPLSSKNGESLNDAAMAQRVACVVLAYEACFRELGDMKSKEE